MSTFQRFGVGLFFTMGLMVGGLLYNRVFVDALLPVVPMDSQFATPVIWLEQLVPVILATLLVATWIWVIAGVAQTERAVDRQRVRR